MNEQKSRNYTINENGSIIVHNYCAAELPTDHRDYSFWSDYLPIWRKLRRHTKSFR